MDSRYTFETFSSESGSFDREFTNYLNNKAKENWKVKHCSYCHDSIGSKMSASCLFKRKQ